MLCLALLLFVAMIVCAIGWLGTKIALLATMKYFIEKGGSPPTDADIHRYVQLVMKQMFKS